MKILKFLFGGLIAFIVIGALIKALFFLVFAIAIFAGAMALRKMFKRMGGHSYYHDHWQQKMQQYRFGYPQHYIESIDDLVQKQKFDFSLPKPIYRERDFI